MKDKQRNNRKPQKHKHSGQSPRKRSSKVDFSNVKSRYHAQKILIPLCAMIICLFATFLIFNYPAIKEQSEFLMPKTRYLIYGLACVLNLVAFVFCFMNIKEYFTLKLTLEGENLQIKHFVPMVINIHDIVDMEISQSILGKLLGYSTVTFFTETRSTYSYVDIINGRRLINAIKKRQPYKTPVEDPDNLFNNLVGKKIAPTDPFQAQNSNRASREERRPRSRRR